MKKIYLLIFTFCLILLPNSVLSKEYIDKINEKENPYSYYLAITKTSDGGYAVVLEEEIEYEVKKELIKYNKYDEIEWKKSLKIASYSKLVVNDIEQSSDGGYIICGNEGEYNPYILKLNEKGEYLWIKKTIVEEFGAFTEVEEGKNGNIYAVGYHTHSSESAENSFRGNEEALLQILDKDGSEILFKKYDGDSIETFTSIQPLDDGSYVISGYLDSIDLFDIKVNKDDYIYDSFIAKFNKDNNIEWIEKYENNTLEKFSEECKSSFKNINTKMIKVSDGFIVVGKTWTISENSKESQGALIVKYDLNGKKLWENVRNDIYTDIFLDVEEDTNGNLIAIGTYEHNENNDEEVYDDVCFKDYSYLYKDPMISVFDKNGKFLGEKRYKDKKNETFFEVEILNNNEIVATGETEDKDDEGYKYQTARLLKVDIIYDIKVNENKNGTIEVIRKKI